MLADFDFSMCFCLDTRYSFARLEDRSYILRIFGNAILHKLIFFHFSIVFMLLRLPRSCQNTN
jgi:hypothetical protein